MTFLTAVTVLVILAKTVKSADSVCPDENTKKLLEEHKVTDDVINLLQGKTFVDIWRPTGMADLIDCSMTQFTVDGKTLKAQIHNILKSGGPYYVKQQFTAIDNVKGQLQCKGEYTNDKKEVVVYDEHFYYFYIDDYVYGYFTCGYGDGYLRMAVSIVKDKKDDAEALKSLAKAEATMVKLKSIMPEEMVKLSQTGCPDKV